MPGTEEQEPCRRPSSTPSRSSLMKKSFRYRPNRYKDKVSDRSLEYGNYRRSTVIHFKQKFRSFKGKRLSIIVRKLMMIREEKRKFDTDN